MSCGASAPSALERMPVWEAPRFKRHAPEKPQTPSPKPEGRTSRPRSAGPRLGPRSFAGAWRLGLGVSRVGRSLFAGLALVLSLAGCASKPSGNPPPPGSEAARLFETDIRFAAQARLLGVAEAFHEFLAERAVQLPNGEPPVQGRQAIYEHQRQAGDVQLAWEPVTAEVARSGELGFTWGFYEVRAREPDGKTRTGYGKYTTIWEKQPDGAWKVILDTGNPGPPPPPPTQNPPRRRPRRRSRASLR